MSEPTNTRPIRVPSGPQMRAAALLFALAEQLTAGIMPAPDDIRFNSYANDRATILDRADAQDVPIQIGISYVAALAPLFDDGDLHAEYMFYGSDRSDEAREAYSLHNALHAEHPCANGRCVDPAAHAEGAHDL